MTVHPPVAIHWTCYSSSLSCLNRLHRSHTIFIARQHTDTWYWYSKSVCPSVSVLSLHSRIRWKRLNILSLFSPYGSPIILVLSASNIFTKFRCGTPCVGAKYRWSIKISRFSINKSLYLANNTRQRHSYYRRRIGNRSQAFEWHRFQWPWVTSKQDFKVTVSFIVK